ncbi:hypothetical protein BHE74_00042289 [Ensete ventricosum]|nr:hypothetical protein BHE74_00042289 [Ensete ventricosum]
MKKSASELVLEAFLRPDGGDGGERNPPPPSLEEFLLPGALDFGFVDRDGVSGHSTGGGRQLLSSRESQAWSHNLTPKHSNISVNMDTQSSIYGILSRSFISVSFFMEITSGKDCDRSFCNKTWVDEYLIEERTRY